MNHIKRVLLMLCLVLVLSACGTKDTSKEGKKLVIYSPSSEGLINTVIPLFEEKTGIKVELISAGTGELLKRLESEAENPQADVLFGVSYSQLLSNTKSFDTYVAKGNDEVLEPYRNETGYTTYFILDGSVLIVNKDLTSHMTITSYEDLLDPSLKGKIATADPATSGSSFSQLSNILLSKGGYEAPEAWDYVEALIKQWDGKIQASSSAVYKSVVDGEMAVGLSYEDPVAKLIKDGATHIEIVHPTEGAVFTPTGASLVKGAKHEAEAKQFLDFIIGDEVQGVIGTELTNRPVKSGAKVGDHLVPFDQIERKDEDMNYILEHKEAMISRYLELFVSAQ